jgi:hypothetical protein
LSKERLLSGSFLGSDRSDDSGGHLDQEHISRFGQFGAPPITGGSPATSHTSELCSWKAIAKITPQKVAREVCSLCDAGLLPEGGFKFERKHHLTTLERMVRWQEVAYD